MNIGKASANSGVSNKMIRYYESINLIPAASRSESGYRTYSDRDVQTLKFIKRARDLGFSLKQIKELVALWQDESRSSADVKSLALEHIQEMQQKISQLQEMSLALEQMASKCNGNAKPECPILKELENTP